MQTSFSKVLQLLQQDPIVGNSLLDKANDAVVIDEVGDAAAAELTAEGMLLIGN